jgi:HAD superfamily hydrolase (TIGR01450 family)
VKIDFSKYQSVLLDLDGTVYHEDHPLPGAVDLIRQLQNRRQNFACLSNSTSSPMRVVERLAAMGVEIEPDRIYTAAAATADYVMQRIKTSPRPRVYNLATEGIQEMLEGLVDWVATDSEPCDAVIVGAPANFYAHEERQRMALRLLRKGALALGICADRVYPSPRGLEFGSGALAKMLAYAANIEPIFCGKPQRIFFQELCRRLGVACERCILIGDNLESDIIGAREVGMKTVLTLSGVTRRRDLLNIPEEWKPDFVIDDLTELI